jgi:hypothetical protein
MAFATEEPIFPQLLMFAVTLMTAAMWSPPQAATTESRQGQSRWLRTESQHFAAFDYIESRWGRSSIRRFVNALIVPRVDKTYDAVFGLTPAEFDGAFRNYVERRFKPVAR